MTLVGPEKAIQFVSYSFYEIRITEPLTLQSFYENETVKHMWRRKCFINSKVLDNL